MTALPYNASPLPAYQFIPKPFKPSPKFCSSTFSPSSLAPRSWNLPAAKLRGELSIRQPAYAPMVQSLRDGPVPPSRPHNLLDPSADLASKITESTKARRKLAVEGVRKAVSDAALRKMGIHGGFSSDHTLDQPINLNLEKQNFIEHNVGMQFESDAVCPLSTQDSDVRPQPYSPRQYTPKPLLLPSILALGHPTRSPPSFTESLASTQRKRSSVRSRLSILTCYHVETRSSSLAEDNRSPSASESETSDLRKSSLRCNTPIDHIDTTSFDSNLSDNDEAAAESVMMVEADCGSTIPYDSSFLVNHVNTSPPSSLVSLDAKAEGVDLDIPLEDKKNKSRHTVLEALMWTIAAPRKRTERFQRSNLSASNQYDRSSIGLWLGAALPYNVVTKHDRPSSMANLHQPILSSANDPMSMKLLPRNNNSIDGRSANAQDLSDKPVAQPTFILPNADTRKTACENLRDIASARSPWPAFFRKPSWSFSIET